jgi:predicted MFS family arabinose efflux permease
LPAEAQPPRDAAAPRRLAPPPGELRLLLVLAAVQFTHVVDFMIMMPLGPQFMRLFGIDPRQFGLLVSAYTFAAAASGFLAAFRIDRADRKRALLALYAGFIVATALCGLAPGYATLLAARVVAGAFGGVLGGLVLAIVADLVPYERRAGATAIVASAFSLASVMGIPSALWLAARFSWRAPFLALAATSVAVAVLAIRVLPAMRSHLEPEARSHSRPWGQLQAIFGVANHRRSFTLMIALMFAGFTVIPFIAPYNVANVGVTESDLAVIYFVGVIATLVTSQVIGRLADRYGKRRVFTIVAFLSVVPLFVTTHLPPLPLPQVVAASVLFFVLVPGRFGPAMALVSGSVEPRLRGSFMTFNAAIQQLGAGLAALVAGLIVGRAADGTLTHYGTVGWIAVGFTLLAIWLARRIRILALPGNAAAVPPVAGS